MSLFLLESGSTLLLESGDDMLLEDDSGAPVVPPDRSGFQYTLPRNMAQHTLPAQQQFRLSRQ